MKFKFLTLGVLTVALAMPLGAAAQQSQPPATQQAQGRTTPSETTIQHRWMKRLGGLNLSSDQQQHIQSLIDQFAQAHPQGSPRDPGAARALRAQIMGVLTSDQQSQYHQQVAARRAQQAQRQGQPGQQYQGQPAQQYQGQYQQQYAQPPSGQGPDDQGPNQQGPGGQGPNDQPPGPPPA